jgi:sugar phosphate permease
MELVSQSSLLSLLLFSCMRIVLWQFIRGLTTPAIFPTVFPYVIQFLCLQGPIVPCTHAMLAKWIPPNERSRMGAFVYAGENAAFKMAQSLSSIHKKGKMFAFNSHSHSLCCLSKLSKNSSSLKNMHVFVSLRHTAFV